MKCPTVDKLSQYVDDREEHADIAQHVANCAECQRVVEAFEGEQQFIKETLQTPMLPDDFTSMVLDQLEPYEQKKNRQKSRPWKRILLSAAGVVLALGVSATLSPSFADWVGGMFTSEQADSNGAIVDDGLRMATDDGLVERVNLGVMDNGLTFKVEDVVTDSSRVALSFQVLNKNGKPQDTQLNLFESDNKITVIDQDGKTDYSIGDGWQQDSDYGIVEMRLGEHEALEKMTVKFDLVELNGVKGNWRLEVPIDVAKYKGLTTTVALQDATTNQHGVTLQMKGMQFAPTLNDLTYETGFTQEEQAQVVQDIQQLQERLGITDDYLGSYGTAIEYHIDNEDKKTIYNHDYGLFFTRDSQSGDLIPSQSSSNEGQQLGQIIWHQSFIPQQGDRKLKFVLDGVYKTVPTDFSVTFKPKELKSKPVSFEYEGNFITIKKAKTQEEYSLEKSFTPINRETVFMIEMEGGIEADASTIGDWVLVDDKGNAYLTYGDGSTILVEKDRNNRYKTTMNLKVYDLDEIPEKLTLHLVSVTRYEEVDEKWELPLYEE